MTRMRAFSLLAVMAGVAFLARLSLCLREVCKVQADDVFLDAQGLKHVIDVVMPTDLVRPARKFLGKLSCSGTGSFPSSVLHVALVMNGKGLDISDAEFRGVISSILADHKKHQQLQNRSHALVLGGARPNIVAQAQALF